MYTVKNSRQSILKLFWKERQKDRNGFNKHIFALQYDRADIKHKFKEAESFQM